MNEAARALDYETMAEGELARRIAAGDHGAARHLIRCNNQRLFRAAWSVLKNRAEAEEAVQEGYLKAFAAIGRFQGEAALSTWLTRIVVNEAISQVRAARRRDRAMKKEGLAVLRDHRERLGDAPSLAGQPDEAVMRRQLAEVLQRAIARLPEPFRLVFVLRDVEGLSAEETAAVLGAHEGTVRTRLLRARRRLRADLGPELRQALQSTITFAGADCDALTARVLERLEKSEGAPRP